jgi:hypothetical protein
MPEYPRYGQINTVTLHRHAFFAQAFTLPLANGERAVGSNNSMPGDALA